MESENARPDYHIPAKIIEAEYHVQATLGDQAHRGLAHR